MSDRDKKTAALKKVWLEWKADGVELQPVLAALAALFDGDDGT